MSAIVVAVAAAIGGGKSELVKGLAAALGGIPTIHFDDFEEATRLAPDQLARWIGAGANFDEIAAPGFADALGALRKNPACSASDPSVGVVVAEMPLGRSYPATAGLIDFLIWVDTPLDVALARNLRSLAAAVPGGEEDARGFLAWLDSYLEQYLAQVRVVLDLQRERVAAGADLVLDGLLPPDRLVALAAAAVRDFSVPAGPDDPPRGPGAPPGPKLPSGGIRSRG